MSKSTLGLAALCIAASPCAAQAAYTLKPVLVNGSPAASVNAISPGGLLCGTFIDSTGVTQGFVLNGKALTVLPLLQPQDLPVTPTGIQDDGTVSGLAAGSVELGFVWNGHRYTHQFLASYSGAPVPPPYVLVNVRHILLYNQNQGAEHYLPYTGRPLPETEIGQYDESDTAESINRFGSIGGQQFAFYNSVFIYKSGEFTYYTGPNGLGAFGGFLNDQNQLAGTYISAHHTMRGFVLKHGKNYVTFRPSGGVEAMAVQGFGNGGVVAGTYQDMQGAYHAFAWRDGMFSELLPTPSATVQPTVTGVSDAGDVTLNLRDAAGLTTPYVARCHGSACQ